MNFQPQQLTEAQQSTEDTLAALPDTVPHATPELAQARQSIARSSEPVSAAAPPVWAAALQSMIERERRQAARGVVMALHTTAEQQQKVDAMMQLLVEETASARRAKIRRRAQLTGFLIFIVWALWATRWQAVENWFFYYMIGYAMWAANRNWSRRHHVVSELGQAGDPRAVGVLAIAARDGERAVAQTAQKALLTLLPRVHADHAAGITPDQMNALLELAFRSEPKMQLAVLKALEQIGDQRAIPVVENLSLSPDPVLRAQAKQCLPFLTACARRAEQSATLLRGAASPGMTAGPRELLRPAMQTTDATPAAELLRPIEADKEKRRQGEEETRRGEENGQD